VCSGAQLRELGLAHFYATPYSIPEIDLALAAIPQYCAELTHIGNARAQTDTRWVCRLVDLVGCRVSPGTLTALGALPLVSLSFTIFPFSAQAGCCRCLRLELRCAHLCRQVARCCHTSRIQLSDASASRSTPESPTLIRFLFHSCATKDITRCASHAAGRLGSNLCLFGARVARSALSCLEPIAAFPRCTSCALPNPRLRAPADKTHPPSCAL